MYVCAQELNNISCIILICGTFITSTLAIYIHASFFTFLSHILCFWYVRGTRRIWRKMFFIIFASHKHTRLHIIMISDQIFTRSKQYLRITDLLLKYVYVYACDDIESSTLSNSNWKLNFVIKTFPRSFFALVYILIYSCASFYNNNK